MEVSISDVDYDFLLTSEEIKKLGLGKLESNLIDSKTKEDLGKKVTLTIDDEIIGDIVYDAIPKNASFDEISILNFRIRSYLYKNLKQSGASRGRWEYGDIFFRNSDMLGN